ncbi:MAG: DUF4432 family protein [Clostridiales bacterium]|nr:DUF4432 family protein [Clostridiales bacterium]
MDGKINNLAQIASVRRYVFTDGREKGINVIDCDNGKIRFLLNESKALDIMQVYHEGQNVSFLSKNAFTKREIPFINRFEGGMLYTCGLDIAGSVKGLEPHGTLHNTPAEIVYANIDGDEIRVEANVRVSALFGQNLILNRKITCKLGADNFTIDDTVINAGFSEAKYCILYHINVGYPMLDKDAKIKLDYTNIEACSNWAKENESTAQLITDSVPCQEEMCYYYNLVKPEVSLINEKIQKTLTVTYSQDTLPCFLQWKSMASGDYALGLEPCTSKIGESIEHKKLKANEEVKFKVNIKISKN